MLGRDHVESFSRIWLGWRDCSNKVVFDGAPDVGFGIFPMALCADGPPDLSDFRERYRGVMHR
jgi:hypothetical protein